MNICKLSKMHNKVSLLKSKLLLSQFPSRCFCQEYVKTATIKEDEQFIQKARQNIEKKTKEGVKALKVMQELEYDKEGYFYNRKQYYDAFISKMFQIYNAERRQDKFIRKNKSIHKSIKEVLTNTQIPPIATLDALVKTIRAKGFAASAFDDFTMKELDQSTYITHLIEEIQYSLLPGQFFPPHHIACTVSSLASINYKNSELVPMIRNKMLAIIDNKDEIPQNDLHIDEIIFGGKIGQTNRTNLYRGFKNSNEFFTHVETLLKWKSKDENIALKEETNTLPQNEREEVEEITALMKNILSAVEDTKLIQKEMGEAIESVRSQFTKMTEAFDKFKFLQDHKYIKYELLELEEKMVEAGLIDPNEVTGKTPIEEMPFLFKMRRATEVFYDLTKDYFPEMVPSTETLFPGFYKKEKKSDIDLKRLEQNNQLNLKYIGWILGKLSEMKESVRKDVVDKEFMNAYFRDKCYPSEGFNDPLVKKPDLEYDSMHKPYTRFWNEVTLTYNSMFPKIISLLNSENQLSHLLMLNYGLTQGNVIDSKLHQMIESKTMDALTNSSIEFEDNELIHSIQGLGQSIFSPENLRKIMEKLESRIDNINIDKLCLNEKLRLAWGLCALEQFQSKTLRSLIADINLMPFEHARNELNYSEFLMLKDIFYSLECVNSLSDENKEGAKDSVEPLKITNYNIRVFCKGSNELLKKYPESRKRLDPFKDSVLSGIAKVLSKGDIKNSQLIKFQTDGEANKINDLKYPYTPDLLFQNKGETIALWLQNRCKYNTTLDTCNKNENGSHYSGVQRLHSKILQKLNPDKNIKCVYLNIEDMIDYDLENLSVKVNTEAIVDQLGFLQQNFNNVYIDDLATLGKWFIDYSKRRKSKPSYGLHSETIDKNFIELLGEFFEKNQIYNDRVLNTQESNINTLKSILLKLSLIEDCMTPEAKSEVERFAQECGYSNFQGLLLSIKQDLDSNFKTTHIKQDPKLEKSWIGTRYGVEVPALPESKLQKDLSIELLNRNFMWTDDYFHYDDWATKMKDVYDGFNLCVEANKDIASDEKYFYQDNWRRSPKGIFPDAKAYRKISLYNVKDSLKEAYLPKLSLLKHRNTFTSVAAQNENKPMIVEELLKERKPITNEIKMITSLQNIKNSLKKTSSDSEILSFITNLEFIDSLIGEHLLLLEGKQVNKSPAKLVNRDPKCYREFLMKLDNVKDRYDPYTNFFLKEAAETETTRVILPRKIRDARTKEEREKYQNILDNLLLTEDSQKHSGLNVGTHVVKRNDIKYNYETLIRDENNYNRDIEVYSSEISDEYFLDKQRRSAEANIIKSKIISKLHENKPLTENEKKYIKIWNEKLKNSRYNDLNNCMVPNDPSHIKIGDLNQTDIQNINNVKYVDVTGLNDYAVNDIILELNHFLDDKTIKEIEKEVFIENRKNEWGLPSDFTLIQLRNKEIDLVLGEIEEKAYRYSGKFEEHELKGMNKMFNVKRGEGIFDSKWQKVDQKEYDNFKINNLDDRLELLEKWFCKKEKEIKTRLYLPDERMLDYSKYQQQLREKTIELISKVFSKDYKEINDKDLNEFVEGLSQRMIMFNGSFPNFLPHLVREIVNHPNINIMDKEYLESYCKIFELEWKENPDQPLWLSPIYTKDSRVIEDDLNESSVSEKLQKAGIPYISAIKKKILENN